MKLTHQEQETILFCYSDIFSQVLVDVTITYQKDYSGNIIEYSIDLGNMKVVNEDLKQAILLNFKSERTYRMLGREYFHSSLFVITDIKTGKDLRDTYYSMLKDKFIAHVEKKEWFTSAGRNRLGLFLSKCNITKAERGKIQAYLKAENSQYKCLICLAQLISFYIERQNNNAVLTKMLNNQPRWF